MRQEEKKNTITHHSGRGYMLQLLFHIGLSTLVCMVLEVFFVTNITALTDYLYQTGDESGMVQGFRSGSVISILLYVLLGILLFSLTFLLLQRKNARDIERIARAVEQISAGDLETELSLEGEGELQHIAESISRMERDILELLGRERGAEQSKTELITNVAHDLRTPLTSILGYLELLRKKKGLDPEQRERYLEIAYTKAKRLQKLIEELFGFTKLSYGRLNMNVRQLDIVRLLSQLVEESYPSFEKQGLSYEFTANCASCMMEGDPDLLVRLLDNLLSNAIKYGAEGKRVIVRLRAEKKRVTIKVVNYGYVIPEEELPLIFDKFYRVEHSRAEGTGGTGLGLAIVKNITEMHHGTISVSSDLSGTCFTVKLPLRYVPEPGGFGDTAMEGKGGSL